MSEEQFIKALGNPKLICAIVLKDGASSIRCFTNIGDLKKAQQTEGFTILEIEQEKLTEQELEAVKREFGLK